MRRVGRLGRAAIVAFGAVAAATTAGCSETNTATDAASSGVDTRASTDDAAMAPVDAPQDPDTGNIAPPYGTPPDAGVPDDADQDTGAPVNLYGGAGF